MAEKVRHPGGLSTLFFTEMWERFSYYGMRAFLILYMVAPVARRGLGFSIFYMGINLGAFLGPLIAGYLAQRVDWHIGFACAGVGMILGLTQYVIGRNRLQPAIAKLASQRKREAAPTVADRQHTGAGKRMFAVFIFFVFASLFWGAYEQGGSTLNLFADRYTRLSILGFSFPSSWLQSVQAGWVIVLAPIMAWIWLRLGRREPSSPAKFALGLLFAGLSFLFLVPAARLAQSGSGTMVSPW